MNLNDLQKLIFHRSFDFFVVRGGDHRRTFHGRHANVGLSFFFQLKYHNLYHDNGQSYVLAPDGLQITRQWMNSFHGQTLTDGIFEFARRFRDLNLTENECALVLPFQMCYSGKRDDALRSDWRMPSLLFFSSWYRSIDGRARTSTNAPSVLSLCSLQWIVPRAGRSGRQSDVRQDFEGKIKNDDEKREQTFDRPDYF